MSKKYKLCLDAGHGGHDLGAMGNGLKEKDINLSVVLKVGDILKRHKVDVIYSRSTDIFVELAQRAQIANREKVDVFVSLHCNYVENRSAQGVEVFAYPNSTKGKELSQNILDSIIKDKLYTKNRGIKTNNFAVLRLSKMPACLVELGFISNVEDASILKNKQDELAVAVAKGILAFLNVEYKEDDSKGNAYEQAVWNLINENIIGSPAAWLDVSKVTVNNIKSLVIKFARKIDINIKDYNNAVDVLVRAKIITDRQAWHEDSINTKNAVPLIIKMSSYITQG